MFQQITNSYKHIWGWFLECKLLDVFLWNIIKIGLKVVVAMLSPLWCMQLFESEILYFKSPSSTNWSLHKNPNNYIIMCVYGAQRQMPATTEQSPKLKAPTEKLR